MVLYAAEQRDEQRAEAAAGYPPPTFDDEPETIHAVLKLLIEAGAGRAAPGEDNLATPEPGHLGPADGARPSSSAG